MRKVLIEILIESSKKEDPLKCKKVGRYLRLKEE